ncbi:hypothetical protein F5X99DRAFT_375149 [Biscogniauxia marginata]|nr:hypothetical protein F5X99DRAFT_375149 [Biscogniauxia marginata]
MSIAEPSPGQNTQGTSLSGLAQSSQPGKPSRVLACILCQQRKVRCDRKFPCANCIKSRAQCMPATLAPRRRRRMFPERELLARVHHYESLLRQNNVKFEPLRKDPSGEYESPHQAEPNYESDEEQPDSASANQASASTAASRGRVYKAKNLWHAMKQEDDEEDSSNRDVSEANIKEVWDLLSRDSDHLLFGVRNSSVDLSTLHPEPIQIFRLWQIYLDNVNPLLKVTHTPNLQRCIVEATGNTSNIKPELEALMFAIYCISVSTLTADHCQSIFTFSKQDLLTRFHFGCQQALQNCRFLQTSDRDVLTALFLYLVSLGPRANPRSISSMFGIAIRIAERIGIHDEAICTKSPVLEAELGRRLWWSLKLFDARIGELADYKSAILGTTWDCQIPLNVNDSDLCPETTRIPAAQATPTEALFVVVRSVLGDFIRHSRFHLDFISPSLKHVDHSRHPPVGDGLLSIERTIEENYFRFCDPDNSLHFMAMCTIRGHLARCRLVEYYSQHLGSDVEETDGQRDTAISYALSMLECDTKVMSSPLTQGYIWLYQFHFPFLAYIHVTKALRRRPLCQLAERAWEVMSDNHDARLNGRSTNDNPVYDMFSRIVLNAWEACEDASMQKGISFALPRMVSDIRLRRIQKAVSTEATHVKESNDGFLMDTTLYNGPISTSMPTGPSKPDLLTPQAEGQDSYTGVDLNPYPQLSGRSPLDDSGYQLDWESLNWTGYGWPGL